MNRCSTKLAIREIKFKTTIKYPCNSTRLAKIIKTHNKASLSKDMEQCELANMAAGSVNRTTTLESW